MPYFKDSFSYGNLYVKFEVEMPAKGALKPDQIDALKKILPGPKSTTIAKDQKNVEYLEDFHPDEMNGNPEGGKAQEEEQEYEDGHQGSGVKC